MNKIQYADQYMIDTYIALCNRLGRLASKKDITECSEMPHGDTVKVRFGSMKNFRSMASVAKNNEAPGKLLKEVVEKLLMDKRIHKARRLDCFEISIDPTLPPVNYVRRLYDNKPIQEIWEEIESKIPRNIASYLGI